MDKKILIINLLVSPYPLQHSTYLSQFLSCLFVLRKQVFTGYDFLKNFDCNFGVPAIQLFLPGQVFQVFDDVERVLLCYV